MCKMTSSTYNLTNPCLRLLVLSILFSSSQARRNATTTTGGLYDVTSQLIGRTMYAQYMYEGFINRWIGPFGEYDSYYAEYDGYLRDVQPQFVYDPANKVRLQVVDCQNGFACIRTRWRDEVSSNSDHTWYLQADWLDVDFETTATPALNSQFHWKILCKDDTSLSECFIESRYYPDNVQYARIFATNSYTLDTDWAASHPESWFSFKILVPSAKGIGYYDTQTTECNTGRRNRTEHLTAMVGTTVNDKQSWFMSDSITDEIRAGFEHALELDELLDKDVWTTELKQGDAFKVPSSRKLKVSVKPGTRVVISQVLGAYGEAYTIHTGSTITTKIVPC